MLFNVRVNFCKCLFAFINIFLQNFMKIQKNIILPRIYFERLEFLENLISILRTFQCK